MRAIDADALRDRLQNLADDEWNRSTPTSWAEAFSECADMVDEQPTIEPEPHWIPCDKGEPNEDMECWVTVKTTDALYRGNFTRRYGERRDKGFITSGGFMWWNTALAWMPIYEPEPYKESES